MEKILIHKKYLPNPDLINRIVELSEEAAEVNSGRDLILLNKTFPKELIVYLWKNNIPYTSLEEIILW